MKSILILLSTCILLCSSLFAQEVTNIRFKQDGKMIYICYDLSGEGTYEINVYCSQDGGNNWGESLIQVSGAVGKGQKAGSNKKITWNVLTEKEKLQGDVKFKVEAVSGIDCGESITVNHRLGSVAPVSKTVIYSTVTNIPGETSKCWITQNLGSDRQATTVSEAAEAPAGWYWQFNRKQGYKHDGTTRMPNTAWISSISENTDWQAANDPCTIELGSGWRIPTYTEWYNVDDAGNWSNWNGPWSSGLKLHAAGHLNLGGGSLHYRGSYGGYWSSTQRDNSYGRRLSFYSSNCSMSRTNKAYGRTIRCLRD
jgi:hypothetical protein